MNARLASVLKGVYRRKRREISGKKGRWARLRYEYENFIAKGGKSIFISLVVLFFVCFFIACLVRSIIILIWPEQAYPTGDVSGQDTFLGHLWIIFLEMTDPGNMNQDILTFGGFKISAIVSGILGVIIFSMLIAFITTELNMLLEELKKGHSRVIESEQTLILGWNERVMDILRELIIANESERYASVVILADEDKELMDDVIKTHIPDPKTTRIITRSGTTSSLTNLERVSASASKSAIVLATCSEGVSDEEKQISDSTVVKTILALTKCQEGENDINIVAEIFSESKRNLIEFFDSDLIQSVDTNEILGKILVQTSRTSGLAVVYNEILSFDGSELYFYEADWGKRRFYDILYHFPDGVPLGIRRADGRLLIRPVDPEEMMEPGDEVLILAEDDSTIDFLEQPVARARDFTLKNKRLEQRVEKELILGWHSIAPIIVNEFADYLLEGSQIDIVVYNASKQMKDKVERLQADNETLRINLLDRNPVSLQDLTDLDPFGYDNVIILSMSEGESAPEKVDSETITILLLLRRVFKEAGRSLGETTGSAAAGSATDSSSACGDTPGETGAFPKKTKIITQVMNSENQELMARTNVDDFIISNKMISMIFAQLSEEGDIRRVYDDLFEESGSEIYLKPATLYFESLPIEVTFADMMGIAHKREEICLGVRLGRLSDDPKKNFGITLVPEKNKVYTLTENDCLVVLAEDEL